MQQYTVQAPAAFTGAGLHTGACCHVVVLPAPENAGLCFRRIDVQNAGLQASQEHIIEAAPENVVHCRNGTSLANDSGDRIATIEHLMAALAICGVSNAIIDVDGPEIPILDGSSTLFVSGLKKAGLKPQHAEQSMIEVAKPIMVRDGDRFISIEPAASFSLDVSIDFEDCLIGRQTLSIHLDDPLELERLARSRTFCRLGEVEALRNAGLIRGGSLDNSIVVDGDRLLNDGALRDPDEFVLHKALDLIGDLYLLGAPIRGAVRAEKPGHDLNTRFALALAASPQAAHVAEPGLLATA